VNVLKVLIVEDDLLLLSFLEECLAEAGVEVVATEHPDTALRRLDAEDIEVVLVDLFLRETAASSVIARFRAHLRSPKVVVISTPTLSATLAGAFELGAVDAVTKPLAPVELRSVVNRVAALRPDAIDAYRRDAQARVVG
jgi:DNA-binding response OmpR family regulator